MPSRSQAREVVLQLLYMQDLNPDVPADTARKLLQERIETEELQRFGWRLFACVQEHRAEIDQRLSELAVNWSLQRMPPTDRNALRIGACELLFLDTPPKAAVDEAIELAKRFGSEQSGQFVNGLLDRLMPGGGLNPTPLPELPEIPVEDAPPDTPDTPATA